MHEKKKKKYENTQKGRIKDKFNQFHSPDYLQRGPVVRYLVAAFSAIGYCPVFGISPPVGLCP